MKKRKTAPRDPFREILVLLGFTAEDVRITLALSEKHKTSPLEVLQRAIRSEAMQESKASDGQTLNNEVSG